MKIVISILAFLTFGTLNVEACDCKEVKSIKEEYDYSKSIVTGKIISQEQVVIYDSKVVKYEPDSKPYNGRLIMKYELVLTEVIKGNFKTDTIIIYTGMGAGDCGFRFKSGEKYLIYGIDGTNNDSVFTNENKSLWTINCFRTKKEDKAEIEKLREITKK